MPSQTMSAIFLGIVAVSGALQLYFITHPIGIFGEHLSRGNIRFLCAAFGAAVTLTAWWLAFDGHHLTRSSLSSLIVGLFGATWSVTIPLVGSLFGLDQLHFLLLFH